MLIIVLMSYILYGPRIVMNYNKKKKLILNCLLNQLMKTRVFPSPATLNGFTT